ncbi:unnamed protein product [Cunninghamella echinulata]
MGIICCKEEPLNLDSEIDLTHFALLRSVGKGAFGKVRVVQHKGTKQLYALKYINKVKCIKMRAVDNIISERRIMEQLNYNYIVNLRYAFQDDENLFMVIDLMLGGDLRFHMDRMGHFHEEYVKFYAAEIALGIHYLHEHNIVHRDLKPDNILLDEKGHAHLTDFNIAVQFSEKKPLTSVAGSMAYMAPEILKKRGYFASVDWWSLGIVCYELLFGKRPFKGKSNESLKQSILNSPIEFCDEPKVSVEAIQFIKGLLTREVNERLGVGQHGFEKLKAHPWFKSIQWDKLEEKKLESPFIPDDKRANFDPTHELEEILLEDNPLKAKKRMAKKCGSNTDMNTSFKQNELFSDPEYQVMENKFLTFDFTKPEQNIKYKRLAMQQQYATNNKDFQQKQYVKKKGNILDDSSSSTSQANTLYESLAAKPSISE